MQGEAPPFQQTRSEAGIAGIALQPVDVNLPVPLPDHADIGADHIDAGQADLSVEEITPEVEADPYLLDGEPAVLNAGAGDGHALELEHRVEAAPARFQALDADRAVQRLAGQPLRLQAVFAQQG